MIEVHIRHGQTSPETHWHLTEEGIEQARQAAEYLRRHFPGGFDLGIHSPSPRACETAELLGRKEFTWLADKRLKELDEGRKKGDEVPRDMHMADPPWEHFSWRASSDAESWGDQLARLTSLYQEVDQKYPNKDRIFVSHGGTLRITRMYREGFTAETFSQLFREPYKYFTNCQIIIYSDEDPATGLASPETRWVKSVCPWDEGKFGHDWLKVSPF